MQTRIVILCQGVQSRLPGLPVAKQLLPLPACNNVPILDRTLRQLWKMTMAMPEDAHRPLRIEIVGWPELAERYTRQPIPVDPIGNLRDTPFWFAPWVVTLPDPGNSSLKGIHRYLTAPPRAAARLTDEHTVVLFGDAVYSWRCLQEILRPSPLVFVGTDDISPSGGELWGMGWRCEQEGTMKIALDRALAKHPPFKDTYQAGQMRRWYWAYVEYLKSGGDCVSPRPFYQPVDDFTRDIDLPAHVEMLPALSELAAADDKEHGMEWVGWGQPT